MNKINVSLKTNESHKIWYKDIDKKKIEDI